MPVLATLDVRLLRDRDVALIRAFDAPRRLVFAAHTKPNLVRRWLLGPPGWTMPTCEIDLWVGGCIRYVWRGPNGETMGMSGVFREVVPPERLVHTELFDEDWQGGGVETTTVFIEAAGKTTVTMTMRFASGEARDAALATGMARGMGQSYDRLAEILAEISEPKGTAT